MRKLKRTIAILMALILLIPIVPLYESENQAHAASIVESGSCGVNVTYTLNSDGLLTISGNGAMNDVENFRDVMFNGDPTPWPKDDVKRVIIKEGVTRIGEYTFSDHYSLTDIKIPDSVVSIGKGAFQYCSGLLALVLPKNLTSVPDELCAISNVRYVYIPEGVTKIGYAAFYGINDLLEMEFGGTKTQWNNVVIEEGNECLPDAYMVYKGDNTLSSTQSGSCGDNVTWKLTTDGTLTISGNGNMDSYAKGAIGGYFVEYGDGSDHPWFKYRAKIKKIVISSGVLSVGAYAFFDCFNCTSLEIQNGVKVIKEGAFAHMPISSLTIPSSVSSIGKGAFTNCTSIQEVTIPDSITVIEDKLFEHCGNLTKVTLSNNLTDIKYSAFYGCQFEEMIIPASVKYIGHNFAHVDTVRFLGALPSFDYGEPPAYILMADYWYCLPEYYESYKATFAKWRAEGVLSDGNIVAKLDKTAITLTPSEPTCQLTVSEETGSVASITENWWVEKPKVASVDQNGVVTASGHGKTMLFAEISANGHHSIASCEVATKRNDLMVALLPTNIEADFPVTCGTKLVGFGEVEAHAYQPGKLAETDTSNQYYQQLLSLTNELTAYCSNDEEKAKAIWNWVSTNVTYGGAIGIGNTAAQAYAVYASRKAHCEGFAKLTGFMLYLADIPSCLVASAAHMWNVALLDGKWTMIDSTNKEFGTNYNDYATIEWIGFGTDDLCFVIDNTEGVKLAGVGNHYLDEEREGYTSITIPAFVDIIHGDSFALCTNLKSVVIPKSVKTVNRNAFEDCTKLSDVYYSGSEAEWNAITIKDGNENLTKARRTYGTVLTGISIKSLPTKTSYVVGESFDRSGLTLTATYSDGSSQTITDNFTFSGFNSSTAGTKTITVSYGGKTAAFTVTVKTVPVLSVRISSATATISLGKTMQLSAVIAPLDATNKNVTWTSSDNSVATVSSSGLVTAVAPGTATITVTTADGNKTAKCTVTVKTVPVTGVSISASSATIKLGESKQLSASVSPSDATNKAVTWSSSNSFVANVSSSGLVTAVAPGTATITVTTVDGNKTAVCTVTVKTVPVTGVSVSASSATIKLGESKQLSATVSPEDATNKTVTWSSSNSFVANVSSSGLVTAVAPGTATITVTTADGNKTAVCTVTVKTVPVTGVSVSASAASLKLGETKQLSATVSPVDATNKAVAWSSSNSFVATVSSSGLVTAVAPGTATITVTTADGNKTAVCNITVVVVIPTISIKNPSTDTVNYGDTLVLHADVSNLPEGWKIEWSVYGSGFSISPEDNGHKCYVTSTGNGAATITATLVDENGNVAKDANGHNISAEKQLTSKAGFLQKLISFFKNLFGISRIILQSIR